MTVRAARAVDALLEWSVLGSYSKLGPATRRRLEHWAPLPRLDGRTIAVTGATSGIGRAIAEATAALGAALVLVVRDEARGAALARSLAATHGTTATVLAADLAEADDVRRAGAELGALDRLDGLVHNAGGLSAIRRMASSGDELTFAVHVVAPYLLTSLAWPALRRAAPARVVVVTSGGMYTQPLEVASLADGGSSYVGSAVYARCKRAQVSLVDRLRQDAESAGILVRCYHPGWVDTEGVRSSLPRFHQLMGPLLRTPAEGADTAVWLLAAPVTELGDATVYCDRAPRPLHRLARTRRSDTRAARDALVALVASHGGIEADCAP